MSQGLGGELAGLHAVVIAIWLARRFAIAYSAKPPDSMIP